MKTAEKHKCLNDLIFLCGEFFMGLCVLDERAKAGWRAWSNIPAAPGTPLATMRHPTPEDAVERLYLLIQEHIKQEGGNCNCPML